MLKMAEFYRARGIEVARMRAVNGASFPRHTHDEYVVSANLSGSERIWLDGKDLHAAAQTVTVYNPQAVQASTFGHSADHAEFVSLYVDPAAFVEIGRDNAWMSRSVAPEVAQGVFASSELFRVVLDLYRSAGDESEADFEAATIELAASLLANGGFVMEPGEKSLGVTRLRAVMEYMQANLDSQMSLEALSKIGNVSKFHLIRCFKSAFGMPPAKYHMQLRLVEARRRLRSGQHAMDVALDLGFYDQSHFSNAFKKVMGFSPLQFAEPDRQIKRAARG
ncbi:MAG TPA: AraC family transcriptional regulator [Paraburkholderia sp.]|jgi:AraC-like DNA-binding protein